LFSSFFRPDSLLRAYEFELRGARVAESISPDGLTRTFVITRPDIADHHVTFTVQHDPGTGSVRVERGTSEGRRWVTHWDTSNLDEIASYLRSGELHQWGGFESIPVPRSWYDPPPMVDRQWRRHQ
jgi:hypothetical protein